MSRPKETLSARMQEVSRRFAEKLQSNVDEIEAAWRSLSGTTPAARTAAALDDLIFMAHRLAGSAGSFGFTETGEVASAIETFLRAVAAQGQALSAEDKVRGDQLVGDLQASTPAPGSAQPAPDQIVVAELAAEPKAGGANRPVFLIDDDEEHARDLTQQLGLFGYDMRPFPTAEGLAEAVAQTPPAALILDTAAGIQTLAAIRDGSAEPPPAIVLSNQEELLPRLEAVRAGACAYFNKPVNVTRMVEALNRITGSDEHEPYRILIIEDARPLAELYSLLLEKAGLIAEVVTDPMQVMRPLSEFRPDLILMDINMPGCNGIELAGVIRQNDAFVQMPIVFLTGESSFDRRLLALRTGGDDFLTKPVSPELLISSVLPRAERSRLLGSLISQDSMTGLANHSKTKEHLATELQRAGRDKQPLSFAMIDIDKFKSVNDTYGHWIGDSVIKTLANVLRQRLRTTDVIGRYGGEEFAAILPNTDGPTAVRVLDEIRDGFQRIRHMAGDTEFFVSFSCGVASYPAVDSPELLTTTADEALYAAKRGGRNRVVLAAHET